MLGDPGAAKNILARVHCEAVSLRNAVGGNFYRACANTVSAYSRNGVEMLAVGAWRERVVRRVEGGGGGGEVVGNALEASGSLWKDTCPWEGVISGKPLRAPLGPFSHNSPERYLPARQVMRFFELCRC